AGLEVDERAEADAEALVVGSGGVATLVVVILDHAIHRDAGPERVGGRGGDDVVVGIEGTDVVGADRLLVVAAGPAEADRPGVPVVGAADAVDPLVGAGLAEVVALLGRGTEGEARIPHLHVAVVAAGVADVVGIRLLVEAEGGAAAGDQMNAV